MSCLDSIFLTIGNYETRTWTAFTDLTVRSRPNMMTRSLIYSWKSSVSSPPLPQPRAKSLSHTGKSGVQLSNIRAVKLWMELPESRLMSDLLCSGSIHSPLRERACQNKGLCSCSDRTSSNVSKEEQPGSVGPVSWGYLVEHDLKTIRCFWHQINVTRQETRVTLSISTSCWSRGSRSTKKTWWWWWW